MGEVRAMSGVWYVGVVRVMSECGHGRGEGDEWYVGLDTC